MIELRICGCDEKRRASDLANTLSQALVGWKPFIENEVLVADPIDPYSVCMVIGEENEHNMYLEVKLVEK